MESRKKIRLSETSHIVLFWFMTRHTKIAGVGSSTFTNKEIAQNVRNARGNHEHERECELEERLRRKSAAFWTSDVHESALNGEKFIWLPLSAKNLEGRRRSCMLVIVAAHSLASPKL